jgi:hypothetical protein
MLREGNPGAGGLPFNRCASLEGDQLGRAKAGGGAKNSHVTVQFPPLGL